ncbi:hypothetical protein ABFS82_10G098900 [Erythranthe guttata]
MHLDLSSDAPLGNWVHSFLRNAENLTIEGEFANNLALSELEKVKLCSRMKTLVQIARPTAWSSGVLPTIEVSFGSVREVMISGNNDNRKIWGHQISLDKSKCIFLPSSSDSASRLILPILIS